MKTASSSGSLLVFAILRFAFQSFDLVQPGIARLFLGVRTATSRQDDLISPAHGIEQPVERFVLRLRRNDPSPARLLSYSGSLAAKGKRRTPSTRMPHR
jgi:hypothetical protein